MNYNEHFQSKLTLINQYATCLERQNESKNKQIQTLHYHLSMINKDNQTLRLALKELQHNVAHKKQSNFAQSIQTSFELPENSSIPEKLDACCQTQRDGQERQIKERQQKIRTNELLLKKYQNQCQQMYEGIVKLQKDLLQQQAIKKKHTEKIKSLEEALRIQTQKRISGERYIESISQSIESTDDQKEQLRRQYYTMKNNIEKLIIQNNMLIQRSRDLQKQKNDYYRQLKAQFKMNGGNENLEKSNLKKETKIKDQRWKEIESNLRKLQLQNEAMHSNLAIYR